MEQLEKEFQDKLKINETVGIIYDMKMLLHQPYKKSHPENQNRILSIIQNLQSKKELLQKCEVISELVPATKEQIIQVHPEKYYNYVQNIWPKKYKKRLLWIQDSYVNEHSSMAAELAAGGLITATNKLLKDEWQYAMCVVRPPGHHSGHCDHLEGFCLYNNVVIAAKHAQQNFDIKKVLILDWDVHHGDGTQALVININQQINYDSILFMSWHRYDQGTFYPQSTSGDSSNIGQDQGKGFCVNVAWDCYDKEGNQIENGIVGDQEYIYSYERVFAPIIEAFNPELILISSGFDSALNDPLGALEVQQTYSYIITDLMQKFKLKIIVALEGGYNLESLAWGSESVVRSLLGEKLPLKCLQNCNQDSEQIKQNLKPNKIGLDAVQKTIDQLKLYWPCLLNERCENFEKQVLRI